MEILHRRQQKTQKSRRPLHPPPPLKNQSLPNLRLKWSWAGANPLTVCSPTNVCSHYLLVLAVHLLICLLSFIFDWAVIRFCLLSQHINQLRRSSVVKNKYIHRVANSATALASNMLNSVWSSWISTKYRTLHYLNITYCHTYYDVHVLPCVLGVTSLWLQSLQTVWDELDQPIINKVIKWRTHLRVCVNAKGGHFEHKL